jgi:hypothetical protein
MPFGTFTIVAPARWLREPTEPVRLRQHWLDRGLRSLYLLRRPGYYRNLVSHDRSGSDEGTGPAVFGRDYLETSTTPTQACTLPLGFDCQLGGTFLAHSQFVSGAGIHWSALDQSVAVATGYYGGVTAGRPFAIVTNSDGGAGVVIATTAHTLPLDGYFMDVWSYDGSTLRAAFTGNQQVDTSVVTPATGPITTATIGIFKRSISDNYTDVKMKLFGAARLAWSAGELQAVSLAPYGELFQRDPRRTFVFLAPPPPPPFLWLGQTLVSGRGVDAMIPSGSDH